MRYRFVLDERLGIKLPALDMDWDDYTPAERAQMLLEWEEIRAKIPDRIIDLERIINEKQARLAVEEDFDCCCRLNSEIAELASIINDLNIWFRVQQDYDTSRAHS